jgi:HTH-type transcriptional regulator/antitoxin HipB
MDYPLRLVSQLRAHLQALRKLRHLTQAQLGQRLGLSQVRIAEIEANPGVVSVDQLARILSAVDCLLVLRDVAVDPPAKPAAGAPTAARETHGQRGARTTGSPAAGPRAKKSIPRAKTRSTATMPSLKPKKGSW